MKYKTIGEPSELIIEKYDIDEDEGIITVTYLDGRERQMFWSEENERNIQKEMLFNAFCRLAYGDEPVILNLTRLTVPLIQIMGGIIGSTSIIDYIKGKGDINPVTIAVGAALFATGFIISYKCEKRSYDYRKYDEFVDIFYRLLNYSDEQRQEILNNTPFKNAGLNINDVDNYSLSDLTIVAENMNKFEEAKRIRNK